MLNQNKELGIEDGLRNRTKKLDVNGYKIKMRTDQVHGV